MSVVRIRESPHYRGFFLKKIYENFVGTLETVHDIEVSVLETCPYREVRLYFFFFLLISTVRNKICQVKKIWSSPSNNFVILAGLI